MDQLDQIRQKIDIVDLISQHITLKRAGRNFKANCPFHTEKSPSFIVSPERQIFKCFGCQKGGDIFKFLMEMEGISFPQALKFLAQKAGVELTDFKPDKDFLAKERLLQINHLASEYFQYILNKHKVGKKALAYLQERGVTNNLIKIFKLGYAPDSWDGLLSWLVGKKGFTYTDLEKAGLALKRRGWYARFRGRLMFPLINLQNEIIGFSGRVLDKNVKEAKYINSPETVLYHKSYHLFGLSVTREAIRKANQAVVVEGELDVISSYKSGLKNVVAIKGSALTEGQIKLLKRYCETLILALDADDAGQEAIKRGLSLAENQGLNLKVVNLIEGKDPDDLAQNQPNKWHKAVKKAVSIYDFIIDMAIKKYGKKSPEGKRKVSVEVLPWLAMIDNEIVKAHFVKKLAAVLGVDEQDVVLELEKQLKKRQLPFKKQEVITKQVLPSMRSERLEEYLLSLIIQFKKGRRFVKKIKLEWLNTLAIGKIVNRLQKISLKVSTIEFAKSLPAELQAVFDNAYLAELPVEKDQVEQEIKKVILELEKGYLKKRLKILRQDMLDKKINQKTIFLKKMDKLLKKLKKINKNETK